MYVDGLISTTSVLLLMISMVCYLAVVYSYILFCGVNTLELFFFKLALGKTYILLKPVENPHI